MVSDPVGDLIIQLKNAGMAGRETVSLPYSNLRAAILEKLKQGGYIKHFEKRGKKTRTLEVTLAFGEGRTPRINGVKRVSKPGRRMYQNVSSLRPVKYGQGALVLSTPKGVLLDSEAKKENVGGEALFEIW